MAGVSQLVILQTTFFAGVFFFVVVCFLFPPDSSNCNVWQISGHTVLFMMNYLYSLLTL